MWLPGQMRLKALTDTTQQSGPLPTWPPPGSRPQSLHHEGQPGGRPTLEVMWKDRCPPTAICFFITLKRLKRQSSRPALCTRRLKSTSSHRNLLRTRGDRSGWMPLTPRRAPNLRQTRSGEGSLLPHRPSPGEAQRQRKRGEQAVMRQRRERQGIPKASATGLRSVGHPGSV